VGLRLDHPVAILDGEGHRLLAEHVFAGLECSDSRRSVQVVGREHADGIQVIASHEFAPIAGRGGVVRRVVLAEGVEVRVHDVRAGDHLRALVFIPVLRHRGAMRYADEAEAEGSLGHEIRCLP